MSDEYLKEMKADCGKVEEALKRELTTIRTGQATPRLLENVQVEVAAYGSKMPINQLATISAPKVSDGQSHVNSKRPPRRPRRRT